ncbi:MAG: hypothetical protein VX223_01265 [Myxococcota bacterium]|nr:hypothetical protein [Myxococcota bacterium]
MAVEGAVIEGVQREVLWAWPLKVMAALSGFLLLRWSVTLMARYLLGYSSTCRLEYNGRRLRVQTTNRLLGRDIRSTDEFILSRDMLSVGVEKRFPYLMTLGGLFGLMAGSWVGLGWCIDSVQTNYVSIGLAGLLVIGSGVLLDIIFGSLADYVGDRDSIFLLVGPQRRMAARRGIRVTGITATDAQAFVSGFIKVAP